MRLITSRSLKPPPIEKIIIELTPREAILFVRFFGAISRRNIREVFNDPVEQTVEEIFYLTSGIYMKLREEGV